LTLPCAEQKKHNPSREVLEIITDNLSNAGWSWGCVETTDREGRALWVVAADRNSQRFIVHADEKLTAFVELEAAIRLR